jgi:hypothetical protein
LSDERHSHTDGTKSYAFVRGRFERRVAAAIGTEDGAAPWAARVATAIRAALAAAAAERDAALLLLLPVAGRRSDDHAAFAEMVDDLAGRLRAGAPPVPDAERTARNLVLRLARQTLLHLELDPGEPVTAIAPDLIVFALTPYVGLAEARRLAAPGGDPVSA